MKQLMFCWTIVGLLAFFPSAWSMEENVESGVPVVFKVKTLAEIARHVVVTETVKNPDDLSGQIKQIKDSIKISFPQELRIVLNRDLEEWIKAKEILNLTDEDRFMTELDTEALSISELPPGVRFLTKLTTFYLRKRGLTHLPVGIWKLQNLVHLYLSKNKLKGLPKGIGGLTKLTTLALHRNSLEALPEDLGGLISLRDLYLSNNGIRDLPEGMSNLKSLKDLDLQRNQLSVIPSAIFHLTTLEFLNLGENIIERLPPEIGKLTNLKDLVLFINRLKDLPIEIIQLVRLNTLCVEKNPQLKSLPFSLSDFPKLRKLSINLGVKLRDNLILLKQNISNEVTGNIDEIIISPTVKQVGSSIEEKK